jgi:Mn2+/Fe2+ NRAMP family transporter
MTFSNLVMFAIIVATAQTLHARGQTSIQSAAQAAQALKPFAGHFASAIFALGFIGSGLLAIPVLAGAGSVGMAVLLGKKWGFERSVRKAPVFYGLVALGTLGGTALSLLHVNPIKLLVLVAVINGVAAAPFLVVVMRVSSSKRIMGDTSTATPPRSSAGSPPHSWPPQRSPCSPPEESPSDQTAPRSRATTLSPS